MNLRYCPLQALGCFVKTHSLGAWCAHMLRARIDSIDMTHEPNLKSPTLSKHFLGSFFIFMTNKSLQVLTNQLLNHKDKGQNLTYKPFLTNTII